MRVSPPAHVRHRVLVARLDLIRVRGRVRFRVRVRVRVRARVRVCSRPTASAPTVLYIGVRFRVRVRVRASFLPPRRPRACTC